MKRFLLWLLGLPAALLAAATLALAVSAGLAMDRDFQHTRATAALPEFPATSHEGLTRVPAGNFTFRARVAGMSNAGPGLILLHGFPETSAMWAPLMDAAAERGYRVLAFDQRGYSPGARPAGAPAYTGPELAGDVARMVDAVGFQRFHLVGHDWGSAVGWGVTMALPERVLSWSGLSIPHPAAFGEALQNDPEQRRRSSYFLLFQQPWLPERLFAFNGHRLLRDVFYEEMTAAQRQEYLRVFSEPGAMTAALNWYRALDTSAGEGVADPTIRRPVLFIWGNRDVAVSRYSVEAQARYLAGTYREVELDAGHWLMEEQPEVVVEAVLQHLAAADGAP